MNDVSKLYDEVKLLIDKGNNMAAIEAMERLLGDHENFAQGYHDLAVLYFSVGDKEKTELNFKKAIDCDPGNNTFLKSVADFYYVKMEDGEKALSYYERMISNGVDDAEVYFVAGNLSLIARNFDDAIGYYEKVLEIEPWHMEAFEFLEKVKAHIKSKNMDPERMSVEELYQQATDVGADGNTELAVSLLEKVIEKDPEHALAQNDMGVYSFQMGEQDKSLDYYRRATQLDPRNTNFQKNLADFLCFVKGDVAEALGIYLKLLQEDPEDVEVLMAAGHVSHAIGRLEDAQLFYDRALDIEPWNYEAGEKLDELRAKSNQISVAG